jgi:hypothetical protein
MNRQVNLRDDDIKGLESSLAGVYKGAPPEQAKFIEYLLQRARDGRAAVTTAGPGWLWTWTYNF